MSQQINGLTVRPGVPMREHTRFDIGGPAQFLADASTEAALIEAVCLARKDHLPLEVIGGGSNLIVADAGVPGMVLRFTGREITADGTRVHAGAGAVLQDLVDFTIERGLAGIHTMTGIPGWVGGAVYGNAGAYGGSIDQSIRQVRFFDGDSIREFDNAQCRFRYRESTFKEHKAWIIVSAELELTLGDSPQLRKQADDILATRNAKYPPDMKCAGSIFKNILLAELPQSLQQRVDPKVVREGKIPSAWFLEQAGAKGLTNGDIHVASYHANLVYNAAQGTAAQVREVVDLLKNRVYEKFQLWLEEEVQYVGF